MHRKDQLSSTHEMYLKVLYRVGQQHDVARVRDMAKALGVNPGTVSAVLKKLERAGLVLHDRYGVVALTPTGNSVAECVVRRFETIRAMLTEVLGLDPETAEVDACMMEHAVSPATVNRMERMVEFVMNGRIDLTTFGESTKRPLAGRCCECETAGICKAEEGLG
ncbi:MAG: metal-dependent transcriptional regulator [Phycisphaerae bacterium]